MASATDVFARASNGTRPTPTTLTAILASGSSPGTATCAALTGWPTTSKVHFCIYTINTSGAKVAGSQTDWVGVVSGSTITGLTLKAGTNTGYSVGAVVEASPIAAYADDLFSGLTAQHSAVDGSHTTITTSGTITAATGLTVTSGSITLPAGSISNTALAANTAWTSYVPTWTAASVNPVINNGTLTGAYQQIGKTVFFRIKVIIGTTTTTGTGQWRFALPVTASAGIGTPPGSGLGSGVGTWYAENPGVIGYGGVVATRTTADVVLNYASISASGQQAQVGPASPGSWASTWYFMASGSYEAA